MPDLRHRLLYPRAGWLSLGLLLVMVLALTWAVQGAKWLDQLEFLPPVGFWALVVGALLGVLRLPILVSLPVAAAVGAWVVIWTIGGEYFPGLENAGRTDALRTELLGWTVTVLRTGYPAELSPYALGLGALLWSTAFMAAFAVYRYNRVLDAIGLLGAALIVNLSATLTNLFGHLVLFVIAALLLWLRAALVERQDGWVRRRVNENLEVPAAIMRSGVAFGAAAVVLAWFLTSVAVAAPLTDAWRGLDTVWTSVRDQFEGAFGGLTNPQSRITGNSFGSSFTVSGEWISNDDEALTVAASRPVYLRTATYDIYTGRGFERSPSTRRPVAPGDDLFPGATPERPNQDHAFEIETISIQMHQTIGRNLFTAGAPLEIYAPVLIHEPAGAPLLGGVEAANPIGAEEGYQVAVALSEATEAELAAAPVEYPEVIRELYLKPSDATDAVAELAGQVTGNAANPYERAEALERFLHSDERFTYATRTPEEPRADEDLVQFFLFDENGRIGYCQHYATTMAVMARAVGLPSRVAVGFAPGERQEDGTYLVREANAHAWAEIYFPGYGWQIFEATKSINPQFNRLSGDPAAIPPPRADDPLRDFEFEDVRNRQPQALPSLNLIPGAIEPANPNARTASGGAREGNALLIGVMVLGAATFIWLRFRHLQRRWRLLPAGDRAWERLTSAAGRAGVAPRPSETIYEYAGWLEDQLPAHWEPIRTVADGKVWQAYSGRRMTGAAASRLEEAWARLRLPLVGLAIRRGLRSLLRRGSSN